MLHLLCVLFLAMQCEDPICHVWQHISCVIIPEKPTEANLPIPELFYCEICRLNRADPYVSSIFHFITVLLCRYFAICFSEMIISLLCVFYYFTFWIHTNLTFFNFYLQFLGDSCTSFASCKVDKHRRSNRWVSVTILVEEWHFFSREYMLFRMCSKFWWHLVIYRLIHMYE